MTQQANKRQNLFILGAGAATIPGVPIATDEMVIKELDKLSKVQAA